MILRLRQGLRGLRSLGVARRVVQARAAGAGRLRRRELGGMLGHGAGAARCCAAAKPPVGGVVGVVVEQTGSCGLDTGGRSRRGRGREVVGGSAGAAGGSAQRGGRLCRRWGGGGGAGRGGLGRRGDRRRSRFQASHLQVRRGAPEAALVFDEPLGGFDDAEGDGADHGHDELPDVLQLGLPDARLNGSCSSAPAGYRFLLQTLLRSFLGTLQQLLGDGCVGAFRRRDDSDGLSVAGAFSEAHGPAWFGGSRRRS